MKGRHQLPVEDHEQEAGRARLRRATGSRSGRIRLAAAAVGLSAIITGLSLAAFSSPAERAGQVGAERREQWPVDGRGTDRAVTASRFRPRQHWPGAHESRNRQDGPAGTAGTSAPDDRLEEGTRRTRVVGSDDTTG